MDAVMAPGLVEPKYEMRSSKPSGFGSAAIPPSAKP
jgi:hypothetical protein